MLVWTSRPPSGGDFVPLSHFDYNRESNWSFRRHVAQAVLRQQRTDKAAWHKSFGAATPACYPSRVRRDRNMVRQRPRLRGSSFLFLRTCTSDCQSQRTLNRIFPERLPRLETLFMMLHLLRRRSATRNKAPYRMNLSMLIYHRASSKWHTYPLI